ncbi:MAG TPA: phytoene/squalene synthase family protein [Patescibacteria group bacterium]|nr:phytoene/squalene synthase family protein [Patescibacteria group bacterium]
MVNPAELPVVSPVEPPAPMNDDDLLGTLLRRVSRSFYLTLRVVPGDVRRPIGLAYLLARAADTIADTALIGRADRLKYLELFREALRDSDAGPLRAISEALAGPQQIAAERELLTRLQQAFALLRSLSSSDQSLVRGVVLTLTDGMVMDLATFPGEDEGRLVALQTRADLDRYTYYVAGCAGEFWTDIHMAHRPSLAEWDREAMRRRGVRFGKGLQMTNVLRDLPKDLRIGRCYLPRQELEALGLQPADLLDPTAVVKVKPLLRSLLALTLDHYQEGWAYTLAIPKREIRMRLACIWPLFIGLKTLALLARSPNLLDPGVVIKVPRGAVYRMMARSLAMIGSDATLDRYYRRLWRSAAVSE